MIVGLLRGMVVAGALLAGAYARWLRPRILRWGATDEEVATALPGDEIVPHPRYLMTHAVTIAAPPGAVWPWLLQLGQGRGGLYSYAWLENLAGCDLQGLAERLAGDHERMAPPRAA